MITIAIDAMGGDHGPPVVVRASLEALTQFVHLRLILVGDQDLLQKMILSQAITYDPKRLVVQHATQYVTMDDLPSQALRTKKDASMRVAINLVKEGKANACVSAGNTGALMAMARFVLKTLPGIDRPAIISTFPTIVPHKRVRILDLGANVDSSAENLLQFAVMGSALTAILEDIENPKVFLLNIGSEEIKGNELVKDTARLLMQSKWIHYAGYIEGDAIYAGHADVVVCDGFVGNVALKTTEGVALLIARLMKEAFERHIWTRLAGLLIKPILAPILSYIDPTCYNGATFIGLEGIVIKSHGSATQKAFLHAIKEAMKEVEKNVPHQIRHKIKQLLTPSIAKEV